MWLQLLKKLFSVFWQTNVYENKKYPRALIVPYYPKKKKHMKTRSTCPIFLRVRKNLLKRFNFVMESVLRKVGVHCYGTIFSKCVYTILAVVTLFRGNDSFYSKIFHQNVEGIAIKTNILNFNWNLLSILDIRKNRTILIYFNQVFVRSNQDVNYFEIISKFKDVII